MKTDRDPAELPAASMVDHPAEHCLEALCAKCNRTVDAVCPKCGGNVEASGTELGPMNPSGRTCLERAEFYRRFILLVTSARNARFTLGCYLIATGDAAAEGVTMADFAAEWGVGRAVVSKHCRKIVALLGIVPSRYMRSEETAAGFRVSNRRPVKYGKGATG